MIDKRKKQRIKQEIPFVFSYQEQYFEASTVNFSENGLGIKILGEPSLAAGNLINFSMEGNQISSKIIWVRKLPDKLLDSLAKSN